MSLNIDGYREWTRQTAIYPKDQEKPYLMLGLVSEVGEVADKLKKQIRDRNDSPMTQEQLTALQKELGDIMWYMARLHDAFGMTFEDTIIMNIDKLTQRKSNDTLKGSGDDR